MNPADYRGPYTEPQDASATEVIAENITTHSHTLGPLRFRRDFMIAVTHVGPHPVLGGHHGGVKRSVDIMLTREQAARLRDELARLLCERQISSVRTDIMHPGRAAVSPDIVVLPQPTSAPANDYAPPPEPTPSRLR